APEQLEAVMKRMRSGGEPRVDDRALLGRIFGRGPRARGSPNRPTRNNQSYVVFVLRDGKLVVAPIRTGLTDQDYIEVTSGLTERDTVLVPATASGVIQPILTPSVKSKASGEILEEPVQTGDEVKQGQLLARIDPRIPQSNLTQGEANLAVAQAQLETATSQLKRSEALFQSQSITQAGLDSARLSAATAHAAVATAQANLQTAKDAMQDTHVRAPINGTVLELDAVLGTVISSPTNDVGGGTVILKMANLDTVQV